MSGDITLEVEGVNCKMYTNSGDEQTWILEPRKWVGEGIVDCKFESDAFCWCCYFNLAI